MTDRTVTKLPEDPRLGRTIVNLDPKSLDYPAKGVLFAASAPLVSKTWRRPPAYDQGGTSQCVAYSAVGLVRTQPLTALVPLRVRATALPAPLYQWCQENDEWPGSEPSYFGTSCLAGIKGLQNLGIIPAYRWGFGTEDTLQMLGHHGPVIIGIRWYQGMFSPDLDGFIEPTGPLVGGHAVELHGVNVKEEYVIGTNSYGRFWGVSGRFKIRFDTLRTLLKQEGECVTFSMEA